MDKKITLAHGNGGRLMHELIDILRMQFSNKILDELCDAAELKIKKHGRICFSTDSYVVKPLFFPGGDIGKLAVFGTVNDISMKGANAQFISLAFIIEEGFELSLFKRIARSVKQAADESGVLVVTGDIKVVEAQAADGIFINTSGVGVADYPRRLGPKARVNDVIVVNGGLAEHGMAILNARENLKFASKIKSDCCNLNFTVQRCLSVSPEISIMRDLTRGGLATALNEIAHSSNLGIDIYEQDIPVRPDVKKMCEILGFDPLYVANEGKFACFVNKKDALRIKRAMGSHARIIGEVAAAHRKQVHLKTRVGSSRILPMLELGQLPRIC